MTLSGACVLFDLDGTLVDSACAISSALNEMRAQRGGSAIEIDFVRARVSLGAPELLRQCLGALAGDPVADTAEFRGTLLAHPGNPRDVYEGVAAALATLRDAGAALGVVTNKPQRLATALIEDVALAPFFGAVVGGDAADRPKPAADPILLAMALLAANPARTLFVGDSSIDAVAARAAAMPFLLFSAGYGAEEVTSEMSAARFGRFDELPTLLTGALGKRA